MSLVHYHVVDDGETKVLEVEVVLLALRCKDVEEAKLIIGVVGSSRGLAAVLNDSANYLLVNEDEDIERKHPELF